MLVRPLKFASLAIALVCSSSLSSASAQEAAPAAPAAAAEHPALPALEKLRDRITQAKFVSYTATSKGAGGMLANAYPPATAQVRALRSANAILSGWLVHITGNATPEGKPAYDFDVAWRQTTVEGVDHERKRVTERSGRNIQTAGSQIAVLVRLQSLLAEKPLAEEIAGSSISEGTLTIAGEECDVFAIATKKGKSKHRWAFSRSDHFPRLVEQLFESDLLGGSVPVEFTNVRIENEVPSGTSGDALRVKVPDGYSEDRPAARPAVDPKASPNALPPQPQLAPTAPSQEQPVYRSQQDQTPKENADPNSAVIDQVAAPTPANAGRAIAHAFTVPTHQAEAFTLADHRGKVVVLAFVGSWCLDCPAWSREMNDALSPTDAQPSAVTRLLVAVREKDPANAISTFADLGAPLALQGDDVARAYGVRAYPAVVVVAKDGSIAYRSEGVKDDPSCEALAKAVKDELAQSAETTPASQS
jgi:peroxiredoxin